MKTLAAIAASLVSLATASSIAHADDQKFTVGAAVGGVAQNSGFLLLEEHATMTEMQLHAGYLPNAWVEPGMSVEFASGSGLRSMSAIGDLRTHLFPMLPVNPTVEIGAGMVDEQGTSAGDEASDPRFALVAGGGLETHIREWTVGVELRFMLVWADDQYMEIGESYANTFAHDAIFAGSVKAGVSRSF